MRLLLMICLMMYGLLATEPLRGDDKPARRRPVVVELFTSEGCSSCPPADALLAELVSKQPIDDVQIIPLAFHVDYWNNLGWMDRFSAPKFTQRQRDYGQAMKLRSIYTPQMVVNGHEEFVGSDREAAQKAIAQAASDHTVNVQLKVEQKQVHVRVSDLPSKQ